MQAYQRRNPTPRGLRTLSYVGLLPFGTPRINSVADPPKVVGQLYTSHARPIRVQRARLKPVLWVDASVRFYGESLVRLERPR